MSDLIVAHTIRDQLGPVALMLMGAKNFLGMETCLRFDIGRNAKRISSVRITLQPDDTYTVEFLQKKHRGYIVANKVDGIYFDQLKGVIESNTELYLSFS